MTGTPVPHLSASSPQIEIMTPVYDPQAKGVDLFRKAVDSVFYQSGVAWRWTISIQAASGPYTRILESLNEDWRISVTSRRHDTCLSEHLNEIIATATGTKIHLLCQDDFYTYANSLAEIALALDHFDLIHIRSMVSGRSDNLPAEGRHRFGAFALERARRRELRREDAGINVVGGLTATAWRRTTLPISVRLNYLADLDLRRQLRLTGARVGVLTGASITQHAWVGQAQHWLQEQQTNEVRQWVDLAPSRIDRSICAFGCLAAWKGLSDLADAWSLRCQNTPMRLGIRAVSCIRAQTSKLIHLLRRTTTRGRHRDSS